MAKTSTSSEHEFLLQHASDATKVIAYGWGERGSYAVLFVSGERTDSRDWPGMTGREARRALIAWAIELGFFTEADLDEASAALDKTSVDQLPRKLRTLVDVIKSFLPPKE